MLSDVLAWPVFRALLLFDHYTSSSAGIVAPAKLWSTRQLTVSPRAVLHLHFLKYGALQLTWHGTMQCARCGPTAASCGENSAQQISFADKVIHTVWTQSQRV
jgi:hypothetical protein